MIVSAVSGWSTEELEQAVHFQEQFFDSQVITRA